MIEMKVRMEISKAVAPGIQRHVTCVISYSTHHRWASSHELLGSMLVWDERLPDSEVGLSCLLECLFELDVVISLRGAPHTEHWPLYGITCLTTDLGHSRISPEGKLAILNTPKGCFNSLLH